ncbi:hypothetical protein PR202_gb14292 [Eleusine coracana subsp. coracana]|uniref:Uncharacterized protein n=1 Tax=Eleusine coracana subsp. coracana TaxID=191504 RepID=A0AAV5EUV8_ELECO|nr:hypothetical protein PR202_gb14292 [Eleusine coracana subsp. coracana]
MDAPGGELAASFSAPPPPELAMVARAVQRLVARNDALLMTLGGGDQEQEGTTTSKKKAGTMAAFEGDCKTKKRAAARIGVAEYMERVHRYAALDPECYVVAYAYVDRAAHRRPANAVASSGNVHRLLLACLLVASKVLDDFDMVFNSNYFIIHAATTATPSSRVGGVTNAEMNKLELELLLLLDFEVAVSHRVYHRYRDHLQNEMLRHGGGGVLTTAAKARPPAAPSKMAPLTAAVIAAAAAPRLLKPNDVPSNKPPTIRQVLAVDYY